MLCSWSVLQWSTDSVIANSLAEWGRSGSGGRNIVVAEVFDMVIIIAGADNCCLPVMIGGPHFQCVP